MIDTTSTRAVRLDGSCHCGAVTFTATLKGGFAAARRCICSICRMRGAVALTSAPEAFELKSGADNLASYRFNTRVAEHHFCKTCGIYTHHKRRSNPGQIGVNAACLVGISPFDFTALIVNDGVNHPSDDPDNRTRRAGILRFEPG